MSETNHSSDTHLALAHPRRRRFSPIWLIPIIAAFIAVYLASSTYTQHGPLVTQTFKSAQGIVQGQTQVNYKAVPLGVVDHVRLSDDLSHVVVVLRMTAKAKPLLTDHARFWVVKPRLSAADISSLDTLVSGSYIEMEPGAPGGEEKTDFVGLDNPPADRSDQPGRSFTLNTDSLGSIYEGAPVYFRGVEVGEVLGYQMNSGFAPIAVRIFIRDPYGDFVRAGSQFWNASGVSLRFGPEGVNFATHSLRTVLAGGISFSTPASAESDPPAASDSKFTLYDSQQDADLAQSNDGVAYAAYFRSSVRGLEVGAPVLIYGIQVGKVTDVKLALASPHKGEKSGDNKIRVAFAVKPARVFGKPQDGDTDPVRMVHDMIDKGMRAKLDSSNLLTGQRTLTLEFTPNAQVTTVASEDGVVILPTDNRGTDNVMEALGDVANKLNQIPFDQIGNNLNHLIASADQTVSGQDMQQAVHSLAVTLANAEEISKEANKNMVPALHKLPDIAAQLQEAATHANELMASLDNSYSAGSDFQRSAKRALDQVNEAARSVRLLADFLERHPEALLTGKSAPKDQR